MTLAPLLLLLQAQHPYQKEFDAFRALDAKAFPPKGQILFIGSSTFTRWNDLAKAFPKKHIINRAYGGSTLTDLIRDHKELLKYSPKQIVIYCGENDLAGDPNLAGYDVLDRFKTLYALIRAKQPTVPVLYCAMKPSPSRWHLRWKYLYGNALIEKMADEDKNLDFFSAWDAMLTPAGRPDTTIFVEDMLHMNEKGYARWIPLLEPKLK